MTKTGKYLTPLYLVLGLAAGYGLMEGPAPAKVVGYSDLVEPPEIFVNNNTVRLSGYGDDEIIYFTVDGTIPEVKASQQYQSGIDLVTVPHASDLLRRKLSPIHMAPYTPGLPLWGKVVRASSYDPQTGLSRPAFRTIVTTNKGVKFPILSIALDAEVFFDPVHGVSSLGLDHWSTRPNRINTPWWEWPANYRRAGAKSVTYGAVELLDSLGTSVFSHNVRLRIHGNASRGFPQKSFRIERDRYHGKGKIGDPFNPDNKIRSYLVRTSGNDWGHTLFRDAFMQSVGTRMGLVTQDSRPVHVLVNGVYWGIYNIRSRYDKDFFEEREDDKFDDLALIELDQDVNEGKSKDLEDYKKIKTKIKTAPKNPETIAWLTEHVDIEYFLDYIAFETFFANSDWPNNNVKVYREDKKDTWRWVVYDMDYGLGYTKNPGAYSINMFEQLAKSPTVTGTLFKYLMSHTELKEQFVKRYQDLLENELNSHQLIVKLEEFKTYYASEMPYQLARWRKPSSMGQWHNEVNSCKVFLKNREQVVKSQLKAL